MSGLFSGVIPASEAVQSVEVVLSVLSMLSVGPVVIYLIYGQRWIENT
jgi:hypothetical protein